MNDLPYIVVASDDARVVADLTRILAHQYRVLSVGSTDKTLAWLGAPDLTPELVIVDLSQVKLSVHRLCQTVNSHPMMMNTDVVIIGEQDNALESDALNSGARAYLPYPFDDMLVHARIAVVTGFRERLAVLDSMSHMDGLTSVGNRRRFDESFYAEWKWAVRHQLPLGVLLIDADYFKRYNDHYGHLEGDRCLVLLARALKGCVKRPHDLLARYGGEEFVALVPDVNEAGLAVVAERMLKDVDDLAIAHHTSSIADIMTVSIGGAFCRPQRHQSRRELLLAADEVLYEVKQAGRHSYKIRSLPNC